MHSAAAEALDRKLEGVIKQCQMKDGWPVYDSIEVHLKSLAEEVLKHKQQWLTLPDVFAIFYDFAFSATNKEGTERKELTGGLWNLLGDAAAHSLKAEIGGFLRSIPHSYDVFIPLRVAATPLQSAVLGEKLSLEVIEQAKDVPRGYFSGLFGAMSAVLQPHQRYFRYRIDGYCGNSLQNKTLAAALTAFKVIYQQGIAKKILAIAEGTPSGLGVLSGVTHFEVQKAHLVSRDLTESGSKEVKTELPLAISKLINSVDVNVNEQKVAAAIASNQLPELLKSHFHVPALLIENRAPEAVRVKSAIQWCFDSYAAENETTAFLQTCFGLEALLGDGIGSESLTSTLADRCAYLLADSIRGRTRLREQFKNLYKVRSTLVHGTKTCLDPEEGYLLHWGRGVLEYAIFKEIRHLGM